MENLNKVPNVITGKDLDYLSDMFNWNYTSYKSTYNNLENITDKEVKNMVERVVSLFNTNMTNVLNILGGQNE